MNFGPFPFLSQPAIYRDACPARVLREDRRSFVMLFYPKSNVGNKKNLAKFTDLSDKPSRQKTSHSFLSGSKFRIWESAELPLKSRGHFQHHLILKRSPCNLHANRQPFR